MTKKRRRVTIALHDSEGVWIECYEEGTSFDASEIALDVWAQNLVKNYNETRRLGERERFIDKVTVEEGETMNLKSGTQLIEELIDKITKEEDDDLVIDLLGEMESLARDAQNARQEDMDNAESEEDEMDDTEDEVDEDEEKE